MALFRYDSAALQWTLIQMDLVGSVNHDPLNITNIDFVKCERPDIIAVGARFFVVWTRRYDRSWGGALTKEPAVLECSWIEWSGTAYQVLNDTTTIPNPDGLGIELDSGYHVRECAGVPDAVLLDPGDATHGPTVAAVYPRQTDFGDEEGGNDNTRKFDLRIAACTMELSGLSSFPAPPQSPTDLSNVRVDGLVAQPNDLTAGLVLPDCARFAPLPPPPSGPPAFRFWLAYEEQFTPLSGTVPDGRIRLKLMEGPLAGPWTTLESRTFGVQTAPYVRRRPNVSSYPEGSPFMHTVSIAFNKTATGSGDVVYEEWAYDEDYGLNKVTWPSGTGFDNTSDDDIRPVPVHGRTVPQVRRCYVDRIATPCIILAYDVATDANTVKASSYDGLGRPAVAYRYDVAAGQDRIVLTWEQMHAGTLYQRIWIRVE